MLDFWFDPERFEARQYPSTAWRKYVSRLRHRRSCQNKAFPRAKLARYLRYAVLD
jgi:hypothetical protein